MNYYVLLLIQAPEREQFIEVGLDYELPFHPNLTDEITVADFPCEIKEIYYDLDNLQYVTMRVNAVDNLLFVQHETTKKQIHTWLMDEWRVLKAWAESNNEIIILNDYLFHPEKEINDE
jgi:hypothetical protein